MRLSDAKEYMEKLQLILFRAKEQAFETNVIYNQALINEIEGIYSGLGEVQRFFETAGEQKSLFKKTETAIGKLEQVLSSLQTQSPLPDIEINTAVQGIRDILSICDVQNLNGDYEHILSDIWNTDKNIPEEKRILKEENGIITVKDGVDIEHVMDSFKELYYGFMEPDRINGGTYYGVFVESMGENSGQYIQLVKNLNEFIENTPAGMEPLMNVLAERTLRNYAEWTYEKAAAEESLRLQTVKERVERQEARKAFYEGRQGREKWEVPLKEIYAILEGKSPEQGRNITKTNTEEKQAVPEEHETYAPNDGSAMGNVTEDSIKQEGDVLEVPLNMEEAATQIKERSEEKEDAQSSVSQTNSSARQFTEQEVDSLVDIIFNQEQKKVESYRLSYGQLSLLNKCMVLMTKSENETYDISQKELDLFRLLVRYEMLANSFSDTTPSEYLEDIYKRLKKGEKITELEEPQERVITNYISNDKADRLVFNEKWEIRNALKQEADALNIPAEKELINVFHGNEESFLGSIALLTQTNFSLNNLLLIHKEIPEARFIGTAADFFNSYGRKVVGNSNLKLLRPNYYNKEPYTAWREITLGIKNKGQCRIGSYVFKKAGENTYSIERGFGNNISMLYEEVEQKTVMDFLKDQVIGKEIGFPRFLATTYYDISQTITDEKQPERTINGILGQIKDDRLEEYAFLYETAAQLSQQDLSGEAFDSPQMAVKAQFNAIINELVAADFPQQGKDAVLYMLNKRYGLPTAENTLKELDAWGAEKEPGQLREMMDSIRTQFYAVNDKLENEIKQGQGKELLTVQKHLNIPVFAELFSKREVQKEADQPADNEAKQPVSEKEIGIDKEKTPQSAKRKKKDTSKEYIKQAEETLVNVFHGKMKGFLTTIAGLQQRKFGLNNLLLIFRNMPEAHFVATYADFQNLYGRQVRGSSQITLIQPNFYEKSQAAAWKEVEYYIKENGASRIGNYVFKKMGENTYSIERGFGDNIKLLKKATADEVKAFLADKVIGKEYGYPPFVVQAYFDVTQSQIKVYKDKEGKEVADANADKIKPHIPGFIEEGKLEEYALLYEALAELSQQDLSEEPFDSPAMAVKAQLFSALQKRTYGLNGSALIRDAAMFTLCERYGLPAEENALKELEAWGEGKEPGQLKSMLNAIRSQIISMDMEMEQEVEKLQKQNLIETQNHLNISVFKELFNNEIPIERHSVEVTTINGYDCRIIDDWKTETENYVLGQDTQDNTFFYAQVTDNREQWKGIYTYEYDVKPSRSDVEERHLNNISMIDIDRYEAEYGTDGSRSFPGLNEPEMKEPELAERYVQEVTAETNTEIEKFKLLPVSQEEWEEATEMDAEDMPLEDIIYQWNTINENTETAIIKNDDDTYSFGTLTFDVPLEQFKKQMREEYRSNNENSFVTIPVDTNTAKEVLLHYPNVAPSVFEEILAEYGYLDEPMQGVMQEPETTPEPALKEEPDSILQIKYFATEDILRKEFNRKEAGSFEEALNIYRNFEMKADLNKRTAQAIGILINDGEKEYMISYPFNGKESSETIEMFGAIDTIKKGMKQLEAFYENAEKTEQDYFNKSKLDFIEQMQSKPQENVMVRIYQVKSEYLKDRAFYSYEHLTDKQKKEVEISKYELTAEVHMRHVKDRNTLLASVFAAGNSDGAYSLNPYVLPNAQFRNVSVSDVIAVKAEEDKDTSFYYVNEEGFVKLNDFEEVKQDKEPTVEKFLRAYKTDPVIALTEKDETMPRDVAQIMAGLSAQILPLPQAETDMERFFKAGREIASKAAKKSLYATVVINSSGNKGINKGEILSFQEANIKIAAIEQAINKLRKEYGDDAYAGSDKLDLSIFFKNNKKEMESEVLAYHCVMQLGSGEQTDLLDFVKKDFTKWSDKSEEIIESGTKNGRQITPEEILRYKSVRDKIKKSIPLLNKAVKEPFAIGKSTEKVPETQKKQQISYSQCR